MNVMFVIDNKLYTAPTSGTILKGITRDSVLTLARAWGIEVVEEPLKVSTVIEAAKEGRLQEAFGVGTAATIAPIAEIGFEGTRHQLPDSSAWTISKRILDELNGIRTGAKEDTYGWTYKV